MDVDLSGKVAVITGASSGIGREMALMFAKNGAAVVVGDISDAGAKVADKIKADGGRASFIRADISKQADAQAMADRAVADYGKIDILVNNAGINISMKDRGPVNEFPDDMWEKIINVNLNGTYYCSKAALKSMIKNRYGKIINISSVVGVVPLRNQCAFAASKAAIIQLTKAMAIELARDGINVNAIAPGSINIPLMHKEGGMYMDNRYEKIMCNIPAGRPGTPEDVANAALYLAADEASYVTGHVLVVDGGWTCGFSRDW